MITLLDGAMGTELERRGVRTDGPAWSAQAIDLAPDVISAIHSAYAAAGATVHTATTFRTTPRAMGDGWEQALHRAVALARASVPAGHRVAGSLAPLEDCWHPERSPSDPAPEHRQIAAALATAGVDLVLCETFANVREALIAVQACVETGLPTWVGFTAGPDEDLLDVATVRIAARRAVGLGASAVLVNCVPAARMLRWVEALAECGAPFGAYANAGLPSMDPDRYAELARTWLDAGATIVGGCCGSDARHVTALASIVNTANGPGDPRRIPARGGSGR